MALAVLKRMEPADANAAGFVHGGVILKLCDEAAAIAAMRHARTRVVTAGIGDVEFREPVHIAELVHIDAEVVGTGDTSIEVALRVDAEDVMSGERRHTNSATFTMVAVGEE